ncbi:MAG: cyclic pyranopterin monophosphate synthase MoaC [Trueperaceae bacterium]
MSMKSTKASSSTHFEDGKAVMVDVSEKAITPRRAVAEAFVRLSEEVLESVHSGDTKKGDAVAVAELAGIMAAKKTSDLIPLCHPLPLAKVTVKGTLQSDGVRFEAVCKTTGQTGVEMEAMTAVSVAALTLYDMLKGISKGIVIENIQLLEKEGGKSGLWQR